MFMGLISASVGFTSCGKTCMCTFDKTANALTDPVNYSEQQTATIAAEKAGDNSTECLVANTGALLIPNGFKGTCTIK